METPLIHPKEQMLRWGYERLANLPLAAVSTI